MNLHVTNDGYGFFPKEIARRIKDSGNLENNVIVNLSTKSSIKDDIIKYIPITEKAFKEFIKTLKRVDKLIFHPFNYNSYSFLTLVLQKFPDARVYWVCWSYELYNVPGAGIELHDTFSRAYLSQKKSLKHKTISSVKKMLSGVLRTPLQNATPRERLPIHFFYSFLPSDYLFFQSKYKTSAEYIPFAYLSLNKIMPSLDEFRSDGNTIMIGHSASPDSNHFEMLEKVSSISPNSSIFLPMVYGDHAYASLIKKEAYDRFQHVEVLEKKLDSVEYYNKLTKVGFAIFNVKVQQGLGNIMALIWMGAKVFLNEETGTYRDFTSWGIKVFSIQRELNQAQLSERLTEEEIKNNKDVIFARFNEDKVDGYWQSLLH